MRWEYKFVEFNAINSVSRVYRIDDIPFKEEGPHTLRANFCKQLGLEGWEMLSYSPQLPGDRGPDRSLVVFKRPLPDTGPQTRSWPQTAQ